MTFGDLTAGAPGPAGTVIRWRQAADRDEVLQDLYRQATGRELTALHRLLDPTNGSAVRAGIQGGPAAIVDAMGDRPLKETYWAYASTLVATGSNGGIVGATFLTPPGQLMQLRPGAIASGLMGVTRLAAITVEESVRREGIASALLEQARVAYAACGIGVMYGVVSVGDTASETLARRCGFELLDLDEAVDLTTIMGFRYVVRSSSAARRVIARRVAPRYTAALRVSGYGPQTRPVN